LIGASKSAFGFAMTYAAKRSRASPRRCGSSNHGEQNREVLVMFVGHYSAALAAKAAEPRAPLWTYVIACQVLDIAWSAFVALGVEKVRIDPTLLGSNLVLYQMPWTHSLPAALAWSVAAGFVVRVLMNVPLRAATFVGLVVFSHWVADFAVHRPDLQLWLGGTKVGLGLWNYPVPEEALEIGLLAVTGVFWTAWRVRDGRNAWPAAVFLSSLVVLQIYVAVSPQDDDPVKLGVTGVFSYLAVGFVAWLVERGPATRIPDRLPRRELRA
jgi:hypothetical protein